MIETAPTMTNWDPQMGGLSRRGLLIGISGGAFTCAVVFALGKYRDYVSQSSVMATVGRPRDETGFEPSSWLKLYEDGLVEIICPGTEFGQGAYSTLPKFVAEELDCNWSDVKVVPAPADIGKYGNPRFFGLQTTAGSRTAIGYQHVMRIAGAQARYALLEVAAHRLNVPRNELKTRDSIVYHDPSSRTVAYKQLVAGAQMPHPIPNFVPADKQGSEPDIFIAAFNIDEMIDQVTSAQQQQQQGPAAETLHLKARKEFRLLGVDGPRVDIPAKVDGTAEYGIDKKLPNLAHAMVEVGPTDGSQPDLVDDTAARGVRGIIAIIRLPYGIGIVGESIAAVRKARDLLKITWAGGTTQGYSSGSVMKDYQTIAANIKGHPGNRVWSSGTEDAAKVLDKPSQKLVFEAKSEFVYHATMEPQNATVQVRSDGTVFACVPSQSPRMMQEHIAEALKLKPEQVYIETPYVGGAFGRRLEKDYVVDAALLAKATRRPVKVVWTREDDFKRNPPRQAAVCRIEASIGADGLSVALHHRIVADSWWLWRLPDLFQMAKGTDAGNWCGAVNNYNFPSQIVDNLTESRGIRVCYLRGIGASQTKFALENIVDMLAEKQNRDPLAYRLELLKKSKPAQGVLKTVAKMSRWSEQRPAGRSLGLAYAEYERAHMALVAEVSVNRSTGDLAVHNVWAAVDCGFALQPDIIRSLMEGGITQGLSIAMFEEVIVEDGVFQQSNYHDYRILRMSECPDIEVNVIKSQRDVAGAAELGIMTIAPAVSNAVARITGKRPDHIPMTPDRIKALLA